MDEKARLNHYSLLCGIYIIITHSAPAQLGHSLLPFTMSQGPIFVLST